MPTNASCSCTPQEDLSLLLGIFLSGLWDVMDDLTLTEEIGLKVNPLSAGVPPFESLLTKDEWLDACRDTIDRYGIDQFLNSLLWVVHESMAVVREDIDRGLDDFILQLEEKVRGELLAKMVPSTHGEN